MANPSLDLYLGIDFGTSFTKVCVGDPNGTGCSWVVNFTKTKGFPSLDEALIPTKLAICTDGRLLAGLTKCEWQGQTQTIQVAIDYIKMRLANIDLAVEGNQYPFDLLQSFNKTDLNTPENLENLCAYYLSNVILKAKKWVLQNKADLVKNQDIYWSANIGVPVKYCDSMAIERFQKVLQLAWLLSKNQPQFFTELQERMTQLRRDITDEPCFAIPEIAAGVYSYTISRQATPGIYIFFDTGSGTIEGASFRFWRENEMRKIDFYSGEVEALGVNALAKLVNTKVPNSEAQVENDIIQSSQSLLQEIESLSRRIAGRLSRGEHVANQLKVSVEAVENALKGNLSSQQQRLLHLILGQGLIHRQVAKVVMTCKEKAPDYFQQPSIKVFLGGGGKEAEFYRYTIETTHSAFNHQSADVPVYDVTELPFPSDFDMSGIDRCHFHRFAVAYGLSIPKDEGPELKLPSLFPRITLQPPQPITPETGRYPDDHSSM